MWLRLLHTLLDEVNTPKSHVGMSSAMTLWQIWRDTGGRIRAGESVWRPYEEIKWSRQQGMLEAAAAALHLVASGEITARGSLGHLLSPEPYRPAGDGTPKQWQMARRAHESALALACQDPEAARRLLLRYTSQTSSRTVANLLRADLINRGVPEAFLPPPTPLTDSPHGMSLL